MRFFKPEVRESVAEVQCAIRRALPEGAFTGVEDALLVVLDEPMRSLLEEELQAIADGLPDRVLVKVHDYLLSSSHPIGRFKAAAFFRQLGFSEDDWERLQDALLVIAARGDALRGQPSASPHRFASRTRREPSSSFHKNSIWGPPRMNHM